MRPLTRCLPIPAVALAALAAACSSATPTAPHGDLSARADAPGVTTVSATPSTQTQWRRAMSKIPTPSQGCFRGTPLGTTWEQVPCGAAPVAPRRVPERLLSPTRVAKAVVDAPSDAPQPVEFLVTGSNDHHASVSGLLKWAEGSFPQEIGGANETDNDSNESDPGANSYSFQMNSNLFESPACNSSTNFSCRGWEQLVYDPQLQEAYFEFSLIDYAGSCPAPFSSNYFIFNNTQQVCYFNSASVAVPAEAASNLAHMAMTGSTNATTDTLTMFVNGTPFALSQPSALGLAAGWNDTEFNVYGDDNGTEATFNSPTTLVVQVLTESMSATRAAPSCPATPTTGTTAESSSLSLVGSCCAFGGSETGIQFMESNVPGAVAPPCPTLTATPSPISIPAGSQGYTTLSVVGNLVGQSSNSGLQPTSCTISGPVPSWQNTSIQSEEFFFEVPASAAPGTVLVDTATCDDGQTVSIPIGVTTSKLVASPNPVSVVQGACATFQASINPSLIVPPLTISATSSTFPIAGTVSGGGTANGNGATTFSVCPPLSTPTGVYNVTVASGGNVPADDNATNLTVDVTACQPIPESQACASGSYAACGTVGNGCGSTYNCGSCGGSTSCSNGVCCPSGEVGTDGTCCPSGEVYYGGLGCHAPCASGTIPCPIAGECLTQAACTKANNGPQPPNCAKTHTCS